jgi:hypothetical protein
MINRISFVSALFILSSCSQKIYLHRIQTFFNASTIKEKSKYLADDYHSFFLEKKGPGETKTEDLASFLKWDAPLHPDISIIKYSVNKNVWTIDLNEQNDFAKLIDFPGWRATEIITFNSHKLIQETVYVPHDNNPDYKKWLQPAVEWLQKNYPQEMKQTYVNGKLIQTNETAKKWVELLKAWQHRQGN